jgi:sulfite oxidase
LRDVLREVGVRPGARHVAFTGLDNVGGERFAGSIPLGKALSGEVLLADEMNGRPLSPEHGFPLRAVVPGYIGARSVKWLTALTVQRGPSASSFQTTEYAVRGTPLGELPINSAVCRPPSGAVVGTAVRVEGYAHGAGGRPIQRVEVSADGGATWTAATLDGAAEPWSWRLWHSDMRLAPGAHEIAVRARDDAGATQPNGVETAGNPRGYLNNGWHRVRVVSVPAPAGSTGIEQGSRP